MRQLAPIALALALPVWLAAQQPRAGDTDVHVLQVAPTIYMLVGGGNNVTLQVEPAAPPPPRVPGSYRGGYGALLVDTTTPEFSDKMLAVVRRISQGPIRYIINTSIDADHIGGNEALGKPAPGRGGRGGAPAIILGHENMLLQLAALPAGPSKPPQAAMPTDAYLDIKEIWFNGESVQVIHPPAAHTDGDSIVYFRRSDVISAGDIFSTTTYPRVDAGRGGSLQGIVNGLNHILDLAVPETNAEGGTKIIPAHGRLSDEGDVLEYRNMVVMIRDRIQDMVTKGMTVGQVKAARPTLDYDFRYGATTGAWTTDRFIEAVYNELKAAAPARPAATPRNKS